MFVCTYLPIKKVPSQMRVAPALGIHFGQGGSRPASSPCHGRSFGTDEKIAGAANPTPTSLFSPNLPRHTSFRKDGATRETQAPRLQGLSCVLNCSTYALLRAHYRFMLTYGQHKPFKTAKKILATANVPGELQQIYNRNLQDSPLFGLPAEILNRIYRLVMGHNTVHVWAPDTERFDKLQGYRQLYRSICVRKDTMVDEAEDMKQSDNKKLQRGYTVRHDRCQNTELCPSPRKEYEDKEVGGVTGAMNLQLLAFCRKIHKDAALIPYRDNTFSFNWITDLEALAKQLIPCQLRTVQHLSFTYYLHRAPSSVTFEKMLQKKLHGLGSLICFVQFTPDFIVGASSCSFLMRTRMLVASESLLHFQRLAIKNVTVMAYHARGYSSNERVYSAGNRTMFNEATRPWAQEMEKKLLQKWNDEEKDVDDTAVEQIDVEQKVVQDALPSVLS